MKPEELQLLHNIQLTMMDDVHSFCVEHGIRYYLMGGSALGAVRHKGFIPWDVDMDIAMPRSDYQRFLEITTTKQNPKYEVLYYGNKKNLNSPHALIVLKDSKIQYEGGFETYGLYIDVFPLDACPDSLELRIKQMHNIESINKVLRYKKPWKGRIFLFTMYHKIVAWLLKPITIDMLNKMRDKVMRRYEANELTAECWCSMASGYKYTKQCMPQKFYGTPQLIDFEGRKYYVHEHVADYLRQLFGDYMKLPPSEVQEEQISFIKYAEWVDDNGIRCCVGK